MVQGHYPLSAPFKGSCPVLLFTGPIGSGKTTVAREWVRQNPGWVTVNFADLLRAVIEMVYGIPTEEQKIDRVKNSPHDSLNGHTLRFALQWLGTEGFRTVHPDTWTNAWLRTVSRYQAQGSCAGILVDDCRFVNEFLVAEAVGAFVVPVYHAKIAKSWEAQIKMVSDPVNQLRAHLLAMMPWLHKLGVRAHTIHASELQMMWVHAEIAKMDPARVLSFDNTEFDSTGELMTTKVEDLYRRFVDQYSQLSNSNANPN